MTPRKPLIPNRVGRLSSQFNFEQDTYYPKNNETPSVATWSSPGKSAEGASVSGGMYRFPVIRRQFGTR
jgi:hypothetical protein